MDGDGASSTSSGSRPRPGRPRAPPRIAGRRPELAVVRRHLEAGDRAAARHRRGRDRQDQAGHRRRREPPSVRRGRALPAALDRGAPDAGRGRPASCADVDGGWFHEALADCPPFVAESLRSCYRRQRRATTPATRWSRHASSPRSARPSARLASLDRSRCSSRTCTGPTRDPGPRRAPPPPRLPGSPPRDLAHGRRRLDPDKRGLVLAGPAAARPRRSTSDR